MDISVREKGFYAFGAFRLDPMRRVLTCNGEPTTVSPKIFDTLLYLVENPQRIVSKDELLDAIWPGRVVEEANVSQTIFTLRKLLGDGDEKRFIVTAPGRGYRFTAPVRIEGWMPPQPEAPRPSEAPASGAPPVRWRSLFSRPMAAGAALIVTVLAVAFVAQWREAQSPVKPNVAVLVEFQNFTSDPIFDQVLGKALEIDLLQSPFLKVITQQQVRDTLGLMMRPKDEKLTPATAQEVCSRNTGDAVLDGAIAAVGTQYLLTLSATDCASGRTIAEAKETFGSKEAVVPALDRLAGQIRGKLGESRDSLERFDVPLLSEKTASFEALRAYSEATNLYDHGQRTEAVGMFKHAIELDPNFVMAYADLSAVYGSLLEHQLDVDNITKAYALRDTVSERQKFFIQARYHLSVTRDINETIRNYKLWTETYPGDASPWANLSNMENWIGQYPPAIEAGKHALALNPAKEAYHVVLARAYLHAGKFDEARKICEQAIDKNIAGEDTRALLVEIGAARNDDALIDQQAEWAKGKPGERVILLHQAMIAFSRGEVGEGSAMMDKEAELSKQQGLRDYMVAPRARTLTEFGLKDEAHKFLDQLGDDTDPRDYLFTAAEIGDTTRVETVLRQDLNDAPSDTLLNGFYAPQVRAALALRDGKGADAVAALRVAIPYELKEPDVIYLRGTAYLAVADGVGAAVEFQKLLDNPGVSPVSPLHPLARLGLARAYAAQKNFTAAKHEYETFFDAWKDADADIPILRNAKAEYSRLPG